LSLVSSGMGDSLRAGKPSRYVTSHPGQLSLATPPWVGTRSTWQWLSPQLGKKTASAVQQ